MPALITWWTRDVEALSAGADPTVVLDVGSDLLARWTEGHRRYHTTTHLVEMFWALEEIGEAGEVDVRDETVGRLAAWFHDAVYAVLDPRGNEQLGNEQLSNEQLSATLASETLPRLGFRASDVASIERLVRASERHELPHDDALAPAFHDADLWILSAPPERFDTYCAQVRDEYAMVPDAAYATGRAAILRPFLDRARIYATAWGLGQWEELARDNLRRELNRLA